MFKCESCGTMSKPGEKCHKKVVATREKEYRNGNTVSYGSEISKEINICEKCKTV